MFYIKKRRHKPLYKQFVRLRQNVQNRRILRIKKIAVPNRDYYDKTLVIKFKKRKWQGFIKYLERILKYRKRNFRMYDLRLYHIQKFNNYFKKKFANKILVKKKISLFYGNLLEKYIKKQVNISLKKATYSKRNFGNVNFFFLKILESRLDTILYRSFFTLSIRSARQLISHGHVLVNKNVIKTSSFILKKGDLIEINPKYHKLIKKNIDYLFIWPIPPKYLSINFRTFQIIFHGNIEDTNLSTQFPFYLDVNTLLKYYR